MIIKALNLRKTIMKTTNSQPRKDLHPHVR